MAKKKGFTTEITALSKVLEALLPLEPADQAWVLQTAASRLAVPDVAAPNATAPEAVLGDGKALTAHGATTEDLKRFMKQKNPQTDVQRIACLAYFHSKLRKQAHFKSADLTRLNTEAAGPRINMSRAVNNATNQNRYLAAAGGGKKQITPLGEDVVEALPSQEAAKEAEKKGKPRKRAGRRRKARKPKR